MITVPQILIVEDEPLIAADIEEICKEYKYDVAHVAHTLEEAIDIINTINVDYVLLDIQLGSKDDGLIFGQQLSTEYFIPFSYITSFSDSITIQKAKDTHPMGYLIKPFRPQDVHVQIQLGINLNQRIISSGIPTKSIINKSLKTIVSDREFDVLVELCHGKSNHEIGEILFISMNTVKSHLKNLFVKFDVKSRAELINHIHTLN